MPPRTAGRVVGAALVRPGAGGRRRGRLRSATSSSTVRDEPRSPATCTARTRTGFRPSTQRPARQDSVCARSQRPCFRSALPPNTTASKGWRRVPRRTCPLARAGPSRPVWPALPAQTRLAGRSSARHLSFPAQGDPDRRDRSRPMRPPRCRRGSRRAPDGKGKRASGPVLHRLYSATIREPKLTADRLLAIIAADPNVIAPSEVLRFEKTRGEPGRLKEGDELLIRMAGPWNAPVKVDPPVGGGHPACCHTRAPAARRGRASRTRRGTDRSSWRSRLASDLPASGFMRCSGSG